MTSIVIDGPIQTQHEHPDGGAWPFAMTKGEQTVFSDTAGGILAHIIPGYDQIADADVENSNRPGHDEALIVRWQSAVATASEIQAFICADLALEERFDPAAETETTLTALFGDKTIPIETFEVWDHEVIPLVLVATDYAPFTERTPVTGNVLWLDPSDEVAYLRSLANLGVISFYNHDEA